MLSYCPGVLCYGRTWRSIYIEYMYSSAVPHSDMRGYFTWVIVVRMLYDYFIPLAAVGYVQRYKRVLFGMYLPYDYAVSHDIRLFI